MLPSLPDQIRAAIAPAHVAVEQTAFARGMVTGTISRADYVAGLAQLGVLHRELEATAAEADLPKHLVPPARLPAIERDLAVLGGASEVEAAPVVSELVQHFETWKTQAPHQLLGAIYVMEGSRMGSMMLARTLTKALAVEPRPGCGLDYHIDGIATRPGDWKAFREQLATHAFTEAEQQDIIRAAVETMETLTALYAMSPAKVPVPELV